MQTVHMGNYLGLLRKIFHNGFTQKTSQGESVGLLGEQLMFKDVGLRFPMLTARKLYWKNVAGELDWMLSGSTNIADLHEHCDSHIWDSWADENGNIGPVYGHQLRYWGQEPCDALHPVDLDRAGMDQAIHWLEDLIKVPWSRRHVLSLWNPSDLSPKQMPSCIVMMQACLTPIPPGQRSIALFGREIWTALNLLVTLRSSDAMLGLPQDIACYALFLKYLADYLGYWPGSLYMTLNNVHIYKDHFEQYQKLMSQAQYLPPIEKGTPQVVCKAEDVIRCRTPKAFFDDADTFDLYHIDNYEPQPFIKMR